MSDGMEVYFFAGELYPEPSFEKLSTRKLGFFLVRKLINIILLTTDRWRS